MRRNFFAMKKMTKLSFTNQSMFRIEKENREKEKEEERSNPTTNT
jgi:hypothetical protein